MDYKDLGAIISNDPRITCNCWVKAAKGSRSYGLSLSHLISWMNKYLGYYIWLLWGRIHVAIPCSIYEADMLWLFQWRGVKMVSSLSVPSLKKKIETSQPISDNISHVTSWFNAGLPYTEWWFSYECPIFFFHLALVT